MNKKGAIGITITLAMIIVAAIVIVILVVASGLLLSFLMRNILIIASILVLIFGFIYGVSKSQNPTQTILVVVLISGLLFGVHFSGMIPQSTVPSNLNSYVGRCSGGWTTLSVSDVSIHEVGDRIRIFGVAKGSECLAINFNKNELNQKLSSHGFEATRDIVGSVRLLEYTKTFPIDERGSYTGNFNNLVLTGTELVQPHIFGGGGSILLTECKNRGYPTTIYAYRPFLGYNIRCVIPGSIGISGDFASARSYGNFKALFNFDGLSITIAGQPRSDQEVQKVAVLRNGDIRIEWTGNLLNLNEVGVPQWDARLIQSQWYLVKKGASQDNNLAVSDFSQCLNDYAATITDTTFDNCRNKLVIEQMAIFQNKISQYKIDMGNLIYDAVTDNNALYVSLKDSPYPAFIMDLKASSVGIIRLQGNPKITQCIQSTDLNSGSNKVVSYTVLNDADADNVEFFSNIICTQGVMPFSTSFQIGAREPKTVTAELIPSNPNQQPLSYSCTLSVTDSGSGKKDSCTFVGKVNYQSGIICSPGQRFCSEDKRYVMRCTDDGLNIVPVQQCLEGESCTYDKGQYKCSGSGVSLLQCEWYEVEVPAGKDYGAFGWRKILNNPIETEAYCTTGPIMYLIVMGGFVILILVIIIISKPRTPHQPPYQLPHHNNRKKGGRY